MERNIMIKYCIAAIFLLFVVSCNRQPSDLDDNNRLKFIYKNVHGEYRTAEIYENYAFQIIEYNNSPDTNYYFYNVKDSKIENTKNIDEFFKLLTVIPKGETLGFYSYCQSTLSMNGEENLIRIAEFCRKKGIKIAGNTNYYRVSENEADLELYHNRILCTCE